MLFHTDARLPISTPLAIIDDEDRIIAVLVGRPVGDDWLHVVAGLEAAINQLGKAAKFTEEECDHRRGPLPAMDFGVSHGGGQKRPSVLKQGSEQNQHAIDAFCADPNVIRAAGFADSGFACYAPKMYQRYSQYSTALQKSDPSLKWNFPKSIFASATSNIGPAAASYDHLDYSNAAAGWCSITSAGTFDPKKGGHLILFDINKVVEFPSGSTILIPSSVMRHGNTPIQEEEGETRVSMTQYSAGALFRWVDNGCIKQDNTSKAHKAYMAATAPERFTTLLDLFSTLDSLPADRLSVFGK
ncbi:hypothetical protein FIBSPDRAFT_764451 [Athelia psychrophila]|uniref:Prolyl 4-hydroxylase alpha subunit Fe(2+) 2OG dioxygenase domain-containing protein n=1 Tax=Athelia psychrophila TaxID=1759441 RepID=A0A167WS46_9AGAM|nr:hypothetical protein FIBSPDRAFT_764451 [Fibularhizoctonia sp. CBS 109695]